MAVHLQKHAGQSEGLIVPNGTLEEFLGLYETLTARADGEWLNSIHHKIHLFRSLFAAAGPDRERITNLFINLFDAEIHQGNDLPRKDLPAFCHKLQTTLPIRAVADTGELDGIDVLCYILRLFKFFVEKGGSEE